MKARKEYIILALVIAALVAYLALHRTGRVHYELPALKAYPDAQIARILIEQPDGSIVLEKKDGQWRIVSRGWSADKNKIKPIIDTIRSLEITALVSEGGNYPAYSLDEKRRIRVTAWTAEGEKLRSFDIGKTAPTYHHTFVKLADDPRVYHASGKFRKDFAASAEELRKKPEKSGDSGTEKNAPEAGKDRK